MADFEGKKLVAAGIILVGLAATILAGIAVVAEFRDILRISAGINNETITIAGSMGTTANDDLLSVSFFGNSTNNTGSSIIGIGDGNDVNWSANGTVQVNISIFADGGYNISYTYTAETTESNAATTFITGLAIFGTFVGILVISVIGMTIVNFFKKK